ncbi:hypothetical protein [Hymenobacter sp. B81]|uniref:hypothetical protein n=1 Tax=Hymenobacter sp. B81 TaxID=3344878 RepID=UPI0037DD4A6A
MNTFAPIMLLLLLLSLPGLHPTAGGPAARPTPVLTPAPAPPGQLSASRRALGRRIPAAFRPAAVRALGRLLRAYAEPQRLPALSWAALAAGHPTSLSTRI